MNNDKQPEKDQEIEGNQTEHNRDTWKNGPPCRLSCNRSTVFHPKSELSAKGLTSVFRLINTYLRQGPLLYQSQWPQGEIWPLQRNPSVWPLNFELLQLITFPFKWLNNSFCLISCNCSSAYIGRLAISAKSATNFEIWSSNAFLLSSWLVYKFLKFWSSQQTQSNKGNVKAKKDLSIRSKQ